MEELEQVAFLRLTSQKLPCYTRPLLLLPVCNPSSREYGFLLRPSHENFPCLLSLKCMWDVCWFLRVDIPQFLLDLFLGRGAIPSPYSQVSASLFKISQLFVRRGEWSLALGRKAPSAWMAKSEGGHRAASHISLDFAVVFLHCCKSYFSSLTTSVSLHIHWALATRLISCIQNVQNICLVTYWSPRKTDFSASKWAYFSLLERGIFLIMRSGL